MYVIGILLKIQTLLNGALRLSILFFIFGSHRSRSSERTDDVWVRVFHQHLNITLEHKTHILIHGTAHANVHNSSNFFLLLFFMDAIKSKMNFFMFKRINWMNRNAHFHYLYRCQSSLYRLNAFLGIFVWKIKLGDSAKFRGSFFVFCNMFYDHFHKHFEWSPTQLESNWNGVKWHFRKIFQRKL